MGLFDYMLKNFDPGGERDLVFIPVGINYDRVIEDRSLQRRLTGRHGKSRWWRSLCITLAYVGKQVAFGVLGRRFRYGYACVNFGRPQSMREYLAQTGLDFRAMEEGDRRVHVAEVGTLLMKQIGLIVPVLPVPLVASVLMRNPNGSLSELDIKTAVHSLMQRIEGLGGHVYIPRADRDYAINVGVRMLTLRRMVVERDGMYTVNPPDLKLVAYYANSIQHLLDSLQPSTDDGSGLP